MSSNRIDRLRRAAKTRARIRRQRTHRLCIFRSPRHVYAQIIEPSAGKTVVSASTTEREVRDQVGYGGNVKAAAVVGKRLAEKAHDAGINQAAFDRSGFKYHGRIKALADAAREGGLII